MIKPKQQGVGRKIAIPLLILKPIFSKIFHSLEMSLVDGLSIYADVLENALRKKLVDKYNLEFSHLYNDYNQVPQNVKEDIFKRMVWVFIEILYRQEMGQQERAASSRQKGFRATLAHNK